MPRSTATTRDAAARSSASARSAIGAYRISYDIIDLGVNHYWDFRTNKLNTNSAQVVDLISGLDVYYKGTSSIANIYAVDGYNADLERANSDYFKSEPTIINNGMTALTIFAWIKLESAVAGQIRSILAHWESSTGNYRGFVFEIDDNHNMKLFLSPDGTFANQAAYTTTETLTDTSAWHFIVATYDTTNRGQFYLDTVQQTTSLTTGSHPSSINSSEVPVVLGTIVPSAPANFFDGLIGICGIAENKSMSSSEITQLYNITNTLGGYV